MRIALLVALVAGAAVGQDPAVRRDHWRALRAERTSTLFEAWEAAGADARERAAAALRANQVSGAPASAAPTLPALEAALRALRDEPIPTDEGTRVLQEFADQLDLRVVPGFFPPADEGRGRSLTVRVVPLKRLEVAGEIEVSLHWIAPDGATREARREIIGPRGFGLRGFEMYIRAPLSEPAEWKLLAELAVADARARTFPVPVPCVEGPSIDAASSPAGPARVAALDHLEREGWRSALWPWEGEVAGIAFESDRAQADWVWVAAPEPRPRCALVLLAPPEEAVGTALRAPLGLHWRELGRRLRCRVLATRAPYPFGSAGPAIGPFFQELPGLSDLPAGTPVFCLARGMATEHLLLGLARAEEVPLAGVAFSTVATRRDPSWKPTGVPFLIVSPPLPDSEAGASHQTWVLGHDQPILNDPALPRIVGDWIEATLADEEGADER